MNPVSLLPHLVQNSRPMLVYYAGFKTHIRQKYKSKFYLHAFRDSPWNFYETKSNIQEK